MLVLVKDGVSESGTIFDTGAEGKEGSTKHYVKVGIKWQGLYLIKRLK